MKHSLEPGLIRSIQLYVLLQLLILPLLRRLVGESLGFSVAIDLWLLLVLPVPLLLFLLAWVPWLRETLGQAFLPTIVILTSAQAVGEKYLTLIWLTMPEHQELNALLLMLRMWLTLHIITLLVSWQYRLRWVIVTALGLSMLDGVFSLPFVQIGSPLYPVAIITFGIRTLSVTIIGLSVGWLLQRQREQQQALAAANQKLAHYAATSERLAISQERNRLAHELHDTLAHSLSGVTVQLGAVQALWDEDEAEAKSLLDQALQHTRQGLTEARRALQALRASPLEDVGLATAISNLARETAARAELELDLRVPLELSNLTLDKEQCIFRVAQEALTNVARHAQATTLQVSLEQKQGEVQLTITDNGQGFDLSQVDSLRYGLKGMGERAEMLGGKVEVASQPGQGATVRLTIPV